MNDERCDRDRVTEECPNPEIHSVNGGPMRYCPCGWIEDVEPEPDPRKEAIKEVVAAIEAHADKWAPAGGNFEQRRLRRHLHIAVRVVSNLDPPTKQEIADALTQALGGSDA